MPVLLWRNSKNYILSLSISHNLYFPGWMDCQKPITGALQADVNKVKTFLHPLQGPLNSPVVFDSPIQSCGLEYIMQSWTKMSGMYVTVNFRVKFKISTPAFKTLESMPNQVRPHHPSEHLRLVEVINFAWATYWRRCKSCVTFLLISWYRPIGIFRSLIGICWLCPILDPYNWLQSFLLLRQLFVLYILLVCTSRGWSIGGMMRAFAPLLQ